MAFPYERIVCLTEETVETLYLLGQQDRIVGISGYVVRPPQARREKPRISAFTSARIDKILALEPDLVLAFSDLQADIVAELIRNGVAVHAFNQRTIGGILDMIRTIGAFVAAQQAADALATQLADRIEAARRRAANLPRRPRVYFEEWDDPLITGIGWVSELVQAAGGIETFPELNGRQGAKDRIVTDQDVIARKPDIIVASWCGKKFQSERLCSRPGYDAIPAVRDGAVHEIKSPLILQPGPAALTDGLDQLCSIVSDWAQGPNSDLVGVHGVPQ